MCDMPGTFDRTQGMPVVPGLFMLVVGNLDLPAVDNIDFCSHVVS